MKIILYLLFKVLSVIENNRDKFKLEIEDLIKDLDTLFDEKERILSSPDPKLNVAKKYKNDQKIDENLNTMHNTISKFKQEVESYKKKKKKVKIIIIYIPSTLY